MSSRKQIDQDRLQAILSTHLLAYGLRKPHYQAVMLESLLAVWQGQHARLLDVGAGTGVMAQAMMELFPVDSVMAIDLVDRFCPTLTVETRQYNGRDIPCEAGAFDAATLNNVLHHVPPSARIGLMQEIKRAVSGPVYIKDHMSSGRLDDVRLSLIDMYGNIPFGGMIRAEYLDENDWRHLARESGYTISEFAPPARYRSGLAALAFPNRLEITVRFDPD